MPGDNKVKKRSRFFWLRMFIIIFVICFVIISGVILGFVTATVKSLPEHLGDIRPAAASQFFDSSGKLIATTKSEENRIPVKLSSVPKSLQEAFIAVEDVRFYQHIGVDPRAILRAFFSNLTSSGIAEGGSTITQQLAKNAVLSQEQTLKRKIQEVFVALQIERKYSKSEILEMYLNQIYFGQGAYGVQSAARVYFDKDVDKLTLAQAAMLAGIPKSPNYYSPLNNLNAAKERQGVVLDQMLKYGFITEKEAQDARKEKIVLASSSKVTDTLDYFIDYVTQIVIEKFGADAVYKEGLKIYTTLDMSMQNAAHTAMSSLPVYHTDANKVAQPQGALVAVDPRNGHVKAMIGGRGTDQFNRAVLAVRQPGSAFKPFVYIAAIDSGLTPATVIEDKKMNFNGYEPNNYDRRFHGKVSLRTALVNSYNIPVVALTQQLGPEKVLAVAQKMGISSLVLSGSVNDVNLAMSLGGLTRGVTPLEMASAYGVLAQNGNYSEPVVVLRVVDRNNKEIFLHKQSTRQVISPVSAYTVTNMMQDAISRGTGYAANIGRPAAGKTGTTSEYNDAWFVGFTPNLSASVWIGNDSGGDLGGMTGGDLPAQIWAKFMSAALANSPAVSFSVPQGAIIPPEPVITKDPVKVDKEAGAAPPIKRPPTKTDDKSTTVKKEQAVPAAQDKKSDSKKSDDTKKN